MLILFGEPVSYTEEYAPGVVTAFTIPAVYKPILNHRQMVCFSKIPPY